MKTALLFIAMIFLFGCGNKHNPCNCGFPPPRIFRFIFVGEAGEDLFFGPNAKYDYRNAKTACGDTTRLRVFTGENPYFQINMGLTIFDPTRTFLFEFFPEKIDTIVFKASEEQTFRSKRECCGEWIVYSFDTYFNGKRICTDCTPISFDFDISQIQIHKIVIK